MIKIKHSIAYPLLFIALLVLCPSQRSFSINYPCTEWWCTGLWGSLWGEFSDGDLDLGYGFSLGSVGIGGNLGDEGYESGWGIRFGVEF